jgi:NAD(P)-dependent dehydrogenase (short-subunit alcohol dehydrogenase family)
MVSSRVWLVTGSSRGLGRHIVRAAALAGDHVLATARDPSSIQDLATDFSGQVTTAALDVTDPARARTAIRTALDRFGRLDVVVNNAGQADLGAVEDTPEESFWRQHAVTYAGVVHVTRAALPILRAQRSGHLLQISSLGARMGTPGLASYQAAKAAVTTFSLSLAAELEPLGIRTTIVEPGNLRTDMLSARSMTVLSPSTAYEASVGVTAQRLRQQHGKQPGDPARAARTLVDITRMHTPPLRLALGSDALRFAATATAILNDQDERWQALSTSIDFADEPD